MTRTTDLLQVAREATSRASKMIRRQAPGAITGKGDRDMATEVDFAVEEALRLFLEQETPHLGFLGEENGRKESSNRTAFWILDPVDGTANFVRQIPLSGVSLGLVDAGRIKLGVIDLPFLGESYWAEVGKGAHTHGETLHVSPTRSINDAVVSLGDYAVGREAEKKNALRFAVTELMATKVQRIRMLGSAATDLAWVARGRLDASIILSNKPWDTAAGVLIAREAGAVVIDRAGDDHTLQSDSTIAVTPELAEQVARLLGEADGGPGTPT